MRKHVKTMAWTGSPKRQRKVRKHVKTKARPGRSNSQRYDPRCRVNKKKALISQDLNKMGGRWGSNPRPSVPQTDALTN